MSAGKDASPRLLRLEEILAQSKTPIGPRTDADPAQRHLASVPAERIRQLTSELQRRADADTDEIDIVTMRVLLNDYSAAVAHLRAVAVITEEAVTTAATPINEARRFMQRQSKLEAAVAAARATVESLSR